MLAEPRPTGERSEGENPSLPFFTLLNTFFTPEKEHFIVIFAEKFGKNLKKVYICSGKNLKKV